MSNFDIVFNPVNKESTEFIEMRREDGHGSTSTLPTYVDTGLVQPTTPDDTQPVSVDSLPLPTGAATEAKQLPDNHNVTVSNISHANVYETTEIDTGLTVTYIGQVFGTNWRIIKLDESVENRITKTYVYGTTNFADNWNNRSSLTYTALEDI